MLDDWKDFVTTTAIKTLKDNTPELVIGYRDADFVRKMSDHPVR